MSDHREEERAKVNTQTSSCDPETLLMAHSGVVFLFKKKKRGKNVEKVKKRERKIKRGSE